MPGKTLDDLEGVVWGDPTYHSSLVETCHRLRRKPVDEFTPADLRIMIGQQIGLLHLLPRALAFLERDPLVDAFYYPGDLLASVIECATWLQMVPKYLDRVIPVVQQAMALLDESDQLHVRLVQFLKRVQ